MKIRFTSIFVLFFAVGMQAQDVPGMDSLSSGKGDVAMIEQLAKLQEYVQMIDRRYDYEIETLLNEEFMQENTDGGGQLTAYLTETGLHKVDVRLFGSNGQAQATYYFVDNQLIFVREKEVAYVYDLESDSMDYSEEEVLFEGAYSYQSGSLLFEETLGKRTYSNTTDGARYHQDRAQEYLELLR